MDILSFLFSWDRFIRMDLFMQFMTVLMWGVCLFVAAMIVLGIIKFIDWALSERIYSEIKSVEGKVSRMDFTESMTTTIMVSNGKSLTPIPQHHPAKYEVKVVTSNDIINIDNAELYRRVRVDELVLVRYQDSYKRYLWQSIRQFKRSGIHLVSIKSIQDQVVHINTAKPTSPHISRLERR